MQTFTHKCWVLNTKWQFKRFGTFVLSQEGQNEHHQWRQTLIKRTVSSKNCSASHVVLLCDITHFWRLPSSQSNYSRLKRVRRISLQNIEKLKTACDFFSFQKAVEPRQGTEDDFNELEEDRLHVLLPEKVTTSLVLSILTFTFIRRWRVQTGWRELAFWGAVCPNMHLDVRWSVLSGELLSVIVFQVSSFGFMK